MSFCISHNFTQLTNCSPCNKKNDFLFILYKLYTLYARWAAHPKNMTWAGMSSRRGGVELAPVAGPQVVLHAVVVSFFLTKLSKELPE